MPTTTSDWEPVTQASNSDWEPVGQAQTSQAAPAAQSLQPPPIDVDKMLAGNSLKSPLSGLAKNIQRESGQTAALGQPFSEVQPSGQVTQRAVNTDPESNMDELRKATKQYVNYQVPSNDKDSRIVAAGKEVANKILDVPEFFTSYAGAATALLGGSGGAIGKILPRLFSADALFNAGQKIYKTYPNWDKMTPKEKDAAMVDVAADTTFGLSLANHSAESAGIRTRIPFTESVPTRNAKDLAFQLDKAAVNRSGLDHLPQSIPDLPLTNPDAPQPDSAHGSPLVKKPDGVVQPDTAPRPDAFGASTPVPPGFQTGQMTPTGKVSRGELPASTRSNNAYPQVEPPEKFNSIQDILNFKQQRINEEIGLYQKVIGLSKEEAEGLQKAVKNDTIDRFIKNLEKTNPEKAKAADDFFERSPYNQISSPMAFKFWNHSKKFRPEDIEHENDKGELATGLIQSLGDSSLEMEPDVSDDKFLFSAISAKKLKDLGATKSDIAKALDKYTTRNSSTQGDKAEYFKSLGARINKFLASQGIDLPVGEFGQKLQNIGENYGTIQKRSSAQVPLALRPEGGEEVGERVSGTEKAPIQGEPANQANQEAVTPAHTDLPQPATGMVRIFNGSKTASGTSFYTAKPDEAREYGPYTQYVDIPKKLHESLLADAAAGKTSQPATPGSVELPEKWQNRAKPVSIAQKEAPDITDADKPVDPKNADDLVKMSPEDAGKWFQSLRGKTGEAESNAKTARANLTKGMTDQQVLDASNEVDKQTRELMKDPVKNGDTIGANMHKAQFLREALHDRGYSREYESGKTLEEQIAAKTSGGTTGIAHRVSESRGVAAERGQGASPASQVEHGRQLLADGADPEKILADFQADPRKATSSDGFSILRARQEQLAKSADRAVDEHGASSPQAAAAAKADADWIERIKPYQTEWAKQGTAQQGETDLDTGSFTALRRSFESEAKKPLTPKQSRDLQKIAGDNKKASDEVDAAIKAVTDSVDKPSVSEKVKSITQKVYDALDEQAKAALQRLNARRGKVGSNLTPQDLADYAILGASQIAKGIIKFPEWSKSMLDQFGDALKSDDLEKIYDVAKQKHLNVVRDNFGEFKAGQPFTPDQVKTLWKYAKDNYITGGEVNFAKIRNNLSNDFGLSKSDVARALTQNSTTRNLLDNAYTKQYRARQLRQYAKTWIKREATPSLVRKVQAIPRGLFNLAVFGHGTTWIGTHAGQNLYDPTQWSSLGRNYAKMWKVAYSPVEYEKEAQDLVARPNWETARRAGLNNDPYTRQGDYDTPELTKWAKTMNIGHRGALGLMTLRQDYFDTVWDNLPATDKNREMAKSVADLTNHATGTTRMKMVENPWTNLLLFAPRLVASRFQWDVADPARAALIKGFGLLGKKPTAQEAMFANHVIKKRAIFVATMLSALGLNQIVLNATGSKQKINLTRPHESDWLRFKGFGMEVAPFSAGVAVARLMAQEYSDFFVNHKHRGGLPFNPAEQAGTDALRYGRAELSPIASHSLDLAAQSDYSGRPLPAIPGRNPPPDEPAYLKREGVKPYTWTQYGLTAAPIPMEGAIQEAFQSQGMNESAAKKYTKLILSAAAMASTGVLVKEDPKAK